jgi:hypothetical protein
MNTYKRGQIVQCKDLMDEVYYKIYTGVVLDQYYTADDKQTAINCSHELIKGNEE